MMEKLVAGSGLGATFLGLVGQLMMGAGLWLCWVGLVLMGFGLLFIQDE